MDTKIDTIIKSDWICNENGRKLLQEYFKRCSDDEKTLEHVENAVKLDEMEAALNEARENWTKTLNPKKKTDIPVSPKSPVSPDRKKSQLLGVNHLKNKTAHEVYASQISMKPEKSHALREQIVKNELKLQTPSKTKATASDEKWFLKASKELVEKKSPQDKNSIPVEKSSSSSSFRTVQWAPQRKSKYDWRKHLKNNPPRSTSSESDSDSEDAPKFGSALASVKQLCGVGGTDHQQNAIAKRIHALQLKAYHAKKNQGEPKPMSNGAKIEALERRVTDLENKLKVFHQ